MKLPLPIVKPEIPSHYHTNFLGNLNKKLGHSPKQVIVTLTAINRYQVSAFGSPERFLLEPAMLK